MRATRRLLGFCWVVLIVGMAARSASADGGAYGPWAYGWGGWGIWAASPYSLGQVPVPPYFSLHPPVYYGERESRSYGTSPYACHTGACGGPKVAPVSPQVWPYRELLPPGDPIQDVAPCHTCDHTAAAPQRVVNPFFSGASAPEQLAKSAL